MDLVLPALAFLSGHPEAIALGLWLAATLFTLLSRALRKMSPEKWDAVLSRYPAVKHVVDSARGAGFDVVGTLVAVVRIVSAIVNKAAKARGAPVLEDEPTPEPEPRPDSMAEKARRALNKASLIP
jgi:hypothetical protein